MAEVTQQIILEYIAKTDKIQSELKAMEASVGNIDKKTGEAGKRMTLLGGEAAKVKDHFTALAATLGVLFVLKKINDFRKECIALAINAQEIRTAFNKLDDPLLLSKLRKATGGLVTDFDLMKSAVKANNFKVPLQDLAKLFEFAKIKSDETGESVIDLGNALINSVGRGQTRGLVQLGIAQEDIKNKVKETGSLYKGMVAIIDDELAKAGEDVVSVQDKQDAMRVSIENTKEEIGQLMLPILDKWQSFLLKVANGFHVIATSIAELQQAKAERALGKFIDSLGDASDERIIANLNVKLLELKGTLAELETQNNSIKAPPVWLDFRGVGTYKDELQLAIDSTKKDIDAINNQIKVIGKAKPSPVLLDYLHMESEALNKLADDGDENAKAEVDRRKKVDDAIAKHIDFLKKLIGIEGDLRRETLSEQAAEIDATKEKYQELRDDASANSKDIERINADEKTALQNIDKKYADLKHDADLKNLKKEADDLKSSTDEKFKIIKDAKDKENALQSQLASDLHNALQTDQQNEIDDVNEKYKRLFEAAKGNKDALIILEEKKQAELDAITLSHAEIQKGIYEDLTDKQKELYDGVTSFIADSISAIDQIQQNSSDYQLQLIEEANKQGLLSDEDYAKQKAAIMTEDAKRSKRAHLFEAILQLAENIVKAGANPFLIALAAISGALQIAVIESTPIPKFKEGRINIDGPGTGTSDSIISRISKGESVITAKATAKHSDILEAIAQDKLDNYLLQFYLPKLIKNKPGGGMFQMFEDRNIVGEVHRQTFEVVSELKELNKKFNRNENIRRNW